MQKRKRENHVGCFVTDKDMKKPYLDELERKILKLNRENRIWTPAFIAIYELRVAVQPIKKLINRIIFRNYNKMLWLTVVLFLLFLITLLGCVTPLNQRVPECVIKDKGKNFFKGYYYISEHDSNYLYIVVSKKEWKQYEIGDTIK